MIDKTNKNTTSENINERMSKNIKSFRLQNKLTQMELAEKMFTTSSTISKWEAGSRTPNLESIEQLAIIFQVDIKELL